MLMTNQCQGCAGINKVNKEPPLMTILMPLEKDNRQFNPLNM